MLRPASSIGVPLVAVAIVVGSLLSAGIGAGMMSAGFDGRIRENQHLGEVHLADHDRRIEALERFEATQSARDADLVAIRVNVAALCRAMKAANCTSDR